MIIRPTQADTGRKVVYIRNRYDMSKPEEGVIAFVTNEGVFVRYGNETSAKLTYHEDLDWALAENRLK